MTLDTREAVSAQAGITVRKSLFAPLLFTFLGKKFIIKLKYTLIIAGGKYANNRFERKRIVR